MEAERLRIDIAPDVRRARWPATASPCARCCAILVDNALRYAPDGTVDIQATPVPGFAWR